MIPLAVTVSILLYCKYTVFISQFSNMYIQPIFLECEVMARKDSVVKTLSLS